MKPPYNFMHSLGFGADNTFAMKDNSNLAISFIANAELKEGTVVKLVSTDNVEAVSAPADKPIGIVVTSEKRGDGTTWKCVIQTSFQALVRGKAITGAISAGDEVAANSFDAADELMQYEPAGSNVAVGVALADAAVGEQVFIGIKRSF